MTYSTDSNPPLPMVLFHCVEPLDGSLIDHSLPAPLGPSVRQAPCYRRLSSPPSAGVPLHPWVRSTLEQSGRDLLRRKARICRRELLFTRDVALELLFGHSVLPWPFDVGIADLRCLGQRPRGIGQMRTCNRTEIGASGGNDAVRVIGF